MFRLSVMFVALVIGLVLLKAQPDDGLDLVHTVGAGDTLISIAHAYGVTLDQLLTLNSLDPEALLQIGQRLVIMRAAEFADDESENVAAGKDKDESEKAVGGNVETEDLPPAPVAEADAPMRDPADLSPRLCFAVYQDENQNGMMEPGEVSLGGAAILLLAAEDAELPRYTTDGNSEPYCPQGLERKVYMIEAIAPPGYGLTSAASLRIDLRAGGRVGVDFGAKRDLEIVAVPPLDPPNAAGQGLHEPRRSLLRELSGLFVLGLAGAVFFSGILVSLFIRGR